MHASTDTAPRSVMYVYPWDLYDHGVGHALEALQACGIDAVQLAFSYHVGTYLHPRNPRRRVHYGGQGALHLDPSVLPPHRWPFTPPVADDVTGPRYLTELLEAVARHGMETIAWVVYLYNHTLARTRPELAVRNAYGDPNGAQLCPANPAVRAYARALTEAAVQHRPLRGFVCESLSYLPYDYGFLNPKAAVEPGPVERLLLGLCFCEHCSAAARAEGVPVGELNGLVRKAIDDRLSRLPDGGIADGASDQNVDEDAGETWSQRAFGGALQAFLNVRERLATSLQRDVLEVASAAGLRVGSSSAERDDPRVSGVPDRALRAHRDELRFELSPGMSDAATRDLVRDARERAGVGIPIYGLVQLGRFASEGALLHVLETARALGVRHFRIYQFGLLTRRQMDWLRRARPIWSDGREDTDDVRTDGVRTDGATTDDATRGRS